MNGRIMCNESFSGSSQIMFCKIDTFQNPDDIQFSTNSRDRPWTNHEGSQVPLQDTGLDNPWMWPGNLRVRDGDYGK